MKHQSVIIRILEILLLVPNRRSSVGRASALFHSMRQVSRQRWIWGIYCVQTTKKCKWFCKHVGDVTRSPKQGSSGPTKRTDIFQKFSKTRRMHSSRMRTTRSSGRPGWSPPGTPRDQTPPRTRYHPPKTRYPPLGPGIPLWTESQTPVKTLPSRNFICGQ